MVATNKGTKITVRSRQRKRPPRRARIDAPPGTSLEELAAQARYVGSGEHKSCPSFAGPPKLRIADATACDPAFKDRHDELTQWLREGLAAGDIGAPWSVNFPRYVWVRREGECYEGHLTNPEQGWYNGYALQPEQVPDWL